MTVALFKRQCIWQIFPGGGLAKHEIDKMVFFKLSQCIRMLTEEDLIFLREDIREKKISGDADYIDDYRGLGLMYEVDGGFCYTKKAFQLLKYALDYERDIRIPEKFPEKNVMTAATEDDINKMFEDTTLNLQATL